MAVTTPIPAADPRAVPRSIAGIAGLGAAFPATRGQRELWDGFFAEHYEHRKKARAIWLRSRQIGNRF